MPVVTNVGDDITLHRDAEEWEYADACGDTILRLLDQWSNPIGVDMPLASVQSVQHVSEEEADEIEEMLV